MKDSYYFPHDYHARHDPKLEKLRMEFGAVSDGIFWDLVEMLYEEDGYLNIKDIQLFSKMLNTPEDIILKVIKTSGLFDIDEKGCFSNSSLLERLNHIKTVRKERQMAGKISGKARQTNKCSTNVQQMRNNIKERKGKERKVNKEKEHKDSFLEFVLLTKDQYSKLIELFGVEGTNDRIQRLNDYIGSKGVKYNSHYHTILNWSRKDDPNKPKKHIAKDLTVEVDKWEADLKKRKEQENGTNATSK